MSQTQEFSRYRQLVSQLAGPGLAGPMGRLPLAGSQPAPVTLALPAARLLLKDDPSQHERLTAAVAYLAELGRPWLRVGVNIGALTERTDSATSLAMQRAVDPLLRRYAAEAAGGAMPRPVGAGRLTFPVPLSDEAGHVREIYHPFAVHLCLAAFRRRYETMAADLWSTCEQAILEIVAPLRFVEYFVASPPPPPLITLVLWQALGLAEQGHVLGRDVDLEMVDGVVQQIVRDTDVLAGPLHDMAGDESPDAWTYQELCGLHALAALALRRRNSAWARRVEQIALYHMEHTQPDHTTNQPWGVFAFLWSQRTRGFAEQQIHDATAHGGGGGGGGVGPLSAMLLADAADCLAEFG